MDPAHLSFTGLEKELGIGLGLGISVGGEEKKLKKKRAHVDINGTVNPRQRTPESDSSYTELSNSTREGGNDESPSSGENEGASAAVETEAPRQTSLSRKGGSLSSRGSVNGRTPRISREDAKRRLMRKRSGSPEYPPTEEKEEADGEGERRGMTDFDLSKVEVELSRLLSRSKTSPCL